jgi:hypothetical protein
MDQGDLHGAGDALKWSMRIVAIMAVVAIVYLVYGRMGEGQSPQSHVAEAQREAALVEPKAPTTQTAPIGGSLRGTMDNTRRTLDLVKKRNGE